MNNKLEQLINIIGEDAVKSDWVLAFGGKSYGNKHLYRVNKIAKYLQSKEGGDLAVVLLGAWVHDVTLSVGSDYDEKTVEQETRKFLDNYSELDKDLKERVVDCAVSHESESEVKSVEAKIVHDADALDKCGALGIVRHIWKMTNMLENRKLMGTHDLRKLEVHLMNRQSHLQTKTAIKIAENLNKAGNVFFDNKKEAIRLMEEISDRASQGETSDKIVDWLAKNEKKDWVEILEYQIDCRYIT